MTTLTFTVDNKIVMDTKTYVSWHKSTICCLELGRNFPMIILFLMNNQGFPPKHLILVPVRARNQTRWITCLIWDDHSYVKDAKADNPAPVSVISCCIQSIHPHSMKQGRPALCFFDGITKQAFVFPEDNAVENNVICSKTSSFINQ